MYTTQASRHIRAPRSAVYRALLDAEDCAFDELEHAYEDGDRSAFDVDLEAWRSAVTRRESFLETNGFTATTPLVL